MDVDQNRGQPEFDIWKADRIEKMYHFQPELVVLRGKVASLSPRLQLALATWCCERLYPSYKEWARSQGTPDRLRPVIDRLWRYAQGDDIDNAEIEKLIRESQGGDFGDNQDDLFWAAIDALGAVWEALQACRERREDHVVMACESCRNRVYQKIERKYSAELNGVITPQDMPLYHARIYADAEMVREERLQSEAILGLMEHEEMTTALRDRLLGLRTER